MVDAVEEEGIEMRRYGPVWTVSVAEMPQASFLNLAGARNVVRAGFRQAAVRQVWRR